MKYLLLCSSLILSSVSGGYPTEFANQSADLDLEAIAGILEDTPWLEVYLPQQDSTGAFPADTLLKAYMLYPDSLRRHFYIAVPESYDEEGLNPLFIWLHGGVSTDELRTMDPEDIHEWALIPRLLEEGYLLAFPCGQMDAAWWDPVGEEGILRIVRWMKFNFMVDDSRVYVGGFSDGASGSFSLMMLHPSPFAGYLAFSGHPGVAALDGGRATYLPSLSNRPGMVTHTDQDGLYPAGRMSRSVALAVSAGAPIEYLTFSGYQHDPAYLREIEEDIVQWLSATERPRFPREIVWEAGEPSGCDWLHVDSIVPWPLLAEDVDFNTLMVSERLQFGFYPDRDHQGEGVFIAGVVDDDVPASRMGFREGDLLVGFQGREVGGLDDLGSLQEGMLPGDSFSVTVLRDLDTLRLRDRFDPPRHYWLLPRQGPSVRVEASFDDNVFRLSVNRLCRLGLLLHREMVDFGRELVVICNGCEVYRGSVADDREFMITNLLMEMDPSRMYHARLELDLEELLPPLMYADMAD